MKKSTLLFIAIILTSFYGVKVFAQGVAINTDGTAPSTMLHIKTGDGTNTVFNILRIDRLNTTAAGADGIGSNIGFFLEGTGAGSMVQAASIDVVFDRAAAPVEGSMTFNVTTAGTLKEIMRVDGTVGSVGIGSNAPGALLDVVSGTTNGTGAKVDVNALTTGTGLAVNSLNAPSTGNAFLVSSNSTGAQVAGIARFNFTGNHGNVGFLVTDVTTAGMASRFDVNSLTTGVALGLNVNALTSGNGINIASTTVGLIGSLQSINLGSNDVGNSGNLLTLNSSGALNVAKALNVVVGSTGNLAGGGVAYNFSGDHGGVGILVTDATTNGMASRFDVNSLTSGVGFGLNVNALTSGNGINIASSTVGLIGSLQSINLGSNNAGNTGNLLTLNSSGALNVAKALNVVVGSTGNLSTGGVMFNFSGDHTGKGLQIDDVTTAGTIMMVNANNLTSGKGLQVVSATAGLTGNLAEVSLNTSNAGNTGNVLALQSGGALSTAKALMVSMGSTGNLTTGGVMFNFSGAHTGQGFQIDDVTTAGTVAAINANNVLGGKAVAILTNALTSGTGLDIESNSAALIGSLQRISLIGNNAANTGDLLTLSSAGALNVAKAIQVNVGSTGNLVSGGVFFNFSGAHSGTGFQINDVTTAGTIMQMNANSLAGGKGLQILSSSQTLTGNLQEISLTGNNAANTGDLLELNSSGVNSVAKALRVEMASTNNLTTGGVFFNFSGAHLGTGFQIDDVTTGGYAMLMNVDKLAAGRGLYISSSSTGLTGALADVTLLGNHAGNTGDLLQLNSIGVLSPAKALKVTVGFGGDMGTGNVLFSFYNSHTGVGFGISDQSLTGTAMLLTTTITTGTGLSVSATNAMATGNAFLVTSNSTGAEVAGITRFNFTGDHTANGFQIDDVTTAGTVAAINANNVLGGKAVVVAANALTTGTALVISSSSAGLTTGTILDISSASTGSTGSLVNIKASGNNAGNTGNVLRVSNSEAAGALSAQTLAMVTNKGTGLGLRVNDDGTDTDASPFLIDATGNVGIGTTAPLRYLDVVGADQIEVLTLRRGSQDGVQDVGMGTAYGNPYLMVGGNEWLVNSIQTIGFGYTLNGSVQPAEIGILTTDIGGDTKGALVFATRNSTIAGTLPSERMRINEVGNVGIGQVNPAAKLVVDEFTAGAANTIVPVLILGRSTDAADGANGIGTRLEFDIEDAGVLEQQAAIDVSLLDVTDGSEDAEMAFTIQTAGTLRTLMKIDGTNSTTGGVVKLYGGIVLPVRAISATTTLTQTDYYITANVTVDGDITVNLPAAATVTGQVYIIKRVHAINALRDVFIDPSGAETIDVAATINLSTAGERIQIISDGVRWDIISKD